MIPPRGWCRFAQYSWRIAQNDAEQKSREPNSHYPGGLVSRHERSIAAFCQLSEHPVQQVLRPLDMF
jgi:hypothetical protein